MKKVTFGFLLAFFTFALASCDDTDYTYDDMYNTYYETHQNGDVRNIIHIRQSVTLAFDEFTVTPRIFVIDGRVYTNDGRSVGIADFPLNNWTHNSESSANVPQATEAQITVSDPRANIVTQEDSRSSVFNGTMLIALFADDCIDGVANITLPDESGIYLLYFDVAWNTEDGRPSHGRYVFRVTIIEPICPDTHVLPRIFIVGDDTEYDFEWMFAHAATFYPDGGMTNASGVMRYTIGAVGIRMEPMIATSNEVTIILEGTFASITTTPLNATHGGYLMHSHGVRRVRLTADDFTDGIATVTLPDDPGVYLIYLDMQIYQPGVSWATYQCVIRVDILPPDQYEVSADRIVLVAEGEIHFALEQFVRGGIFIDGRSEGIVGFATRDGWLEQRLNQMPVIELAAGSEVQVEVHTHAGRVWIWPREYRLEPPPVRDAKWLLVYPYSIEYDMIYLFNVDGVAVVNITLPTEPGLYVMYFSIVRFWSGNAFADDYYYFVIRIVDDNDS